VQAAMAAGGDGNAGNGHGNNHNEDEGLDAHSASFMSQPYRSDPELSLNRPFMFRSAAIAL
jgi:hypothetical protein